MSLNDLGWTPALEFYFADLAEPLWTPCRVSRVDRGRALVLTAAGERAATWRSEIPVVDGPQVDTPAVGDWCAASQHTELLRIETILPRASCIARGISSGERAVQVLAANVDVAFLVTGLDGDFSPRRIERYLVLAKSSSVRPVIVLNKADLCDNAELRAEAVRRMVPGVAVLPLTALTADAAGLIRQELGPGQTAVFLGSSGAGKSTLINQLLGEARLPTAPVRADDDCGRHTTTRRELIVLTGGRAVIDTPGLRAVGVTGDDEGLSAVFGDIAELGAKCRFDDCRHEGEPDCAVLGAVSAGTLDPARLDNYLRLRRENDSAALRQDVYAQRQQERRGAMGHHKKRLREAYRLKGRL
jgi:ribosome biogenesis GTPase / thiamine phosphate phosphatase